jgi:protoporphyrinogen oxidase
MLLRPRKSRIYYNHAFFDYPLSLNAKTLKNFGLIKLSKIALSYFYAKMFPHKNEETLEQFFINRFGIELYDTFFKAYTEKVWGVPCSEIPADWGRQRIKDLNIGKVLSQAFRSVFTSNKSLSQKGTSTSLIEQFLYPQKGPGQMWETVAAKIIELGGEIRLNTRAEIINTESTSRIHSITIQDLASGQQSELAGDYFFSTIPVKHLIRNLQPVTIPEEIQQIAANLAYRDFMIVGLLFKKPENRKGTIAGLTDNWIYLQDQNLIAGRLQIFNNWSPYMVPDKGTVWLGMEYFCNTGDAIWNMDPEKMIELAHRELVKTGLIEKEELLDGTVIKVPKAYPSYIGAYDQFEKLQDWLDGFENLYLIGRNGMHRYNNSDHSMMTAMTAVENIIKNQPDRSNIWAVNMEQDFLETK